MKRILLFTVLSLIGTLSFAQVGIHTNDPAATLDVKNDPNNANQLEGIIAPRITGNLLRVKNYTSAQNGALVYVTEADTAPAGQTVKVTSRGYYYFDATLGTTGEWVALIGAASGGGGGYHKLRLTTNNPIVIQPDDYTIGYTGTRNVETTLPDADGINSQRIIRLCALNSFNGSITIRNLASTQFSGGYSFVSSPTNNNQTCYQIQSDGIYWYVIGSFR